MLTLLGYFDNQEIWYELFRGGLSNRLPERLRSFLAEQANFESVMITLVEYCLIEVQHTTQSYSMHNCVHDWLLGELNSEIEPQLYWYAFDCTAASIDEDDTDILGHVKYARLSRHGLRLTHHRFEACVVSEGSSVGRLFKATWIARMLKENCQFSAVEWICERALAGCEEALGPEHFWTLAMVNNLGIVYSDRGKLVKAEQMYRPALATAEKIFGPHHKRTFGIVNGIGIVYLRQGKLEEAEQMYEQALAGYKRVVGPEHISTLRTVDNIGDLYLTQGKLVEAKQMLDRALAGFSSILGAQHAWTVAVKNGLARLRRLKEQTILQGNDNIR